MWRTAGAVLAILLSPGCLSALTATVHEPPLPCDPLPFSRTRDAAPEPLPRSKIVISNHETFQFNATQAGAAVLTLHPCSADRRTLEVRTEQGFTQGDHFAFVHLYQGDPSNGMTFSSWSQSSVRQTTRLNELPWTLVIATDLDDLQVWLLPEHGNTRFADHVYPVPMDRGALQKETLPTFRRANAAGTQIAVEKELNGTVDSFVHVRGRVQSPSGPALEYRSLELRLSVTDRDGASSRTQHNSYLESGMNRTRIEFQREAQPRGQWNATFSGELRATGLTGEPPRMEGVLVAYPLAQPNH